MQRICDGADERQTDAGAAGLAGTSAVGAVEFLPDLRQLILGQTLACIENGQARAPAVSDGGDDDASALGGVADGVGQVVHEHLLEQAAVRAHGDVRVRAVHAEVFAFAQHGGLLHRVAAHFVQVDLFIECLFRAELELGQAEQLHDKAVHMTGLVRDGVAVELAVLRVVRDTRRQTLGVALNEGDRRFQLVRNIDDEFAAHIVDALLFAYLLRKLIIGLLELADGLLEIGAETVERLAELFDLVGFAPALAGVLGGKVELAHAVGERRHGDERARKLAREEKRDAETDEQRTAAGDEQEHQVERGILLDECERHIGDKVAALVLVERADETEILVVVAQADIGKAVLMLGERGPVLVLHDRGEDRDAAELLLVHAELKVRRGMVAAVTQERGGEHGAVVHRDRQTDGRAALVAVQ